MGRKKKKNKNKAPLAKQHFPKVPKEPASPDGEGPQGGPALEASSKTAATQEAAPQKAPAPAAQPKAEVAMGKTTPPRRTRRAGSSRRRRRG